MPKAFGGGGGGLVSSSSSMGFENSAESIAVSKNLRCKEDCTLYAETVKVPCQAKKGPGCRNRDSEGTRRKWKIKVE